MISSVSSSLYIMDMEHRTIYFEREILQRKIQDAMDATKIKEQSLAEDISYAIEKYVESLRDSHEPLLSIEDVHAFVLNLLNDSGYSEVAHNYASLNNTIVSNKTSKEMQSWSIDRVREVIEENPLFQSYDDDQLVDNVTKLLNGLSFTRLSDSLIVELASHLLSNCDSVKSDQEKNEEEVTSKFLLSSDELKSFCAKKLKQWFIGDVLQVRDISRIYPKIHFDLSFRLYVKTQQSNDEMAMLELMFLPTFLEFVEDIAKSFEFLSNFIRTTFADVEVPNFFTISEFDSGLIEGFNLHGRKKGELREEIERSIERIFSQTCKYEVAVVYLKDN